MSMFDEVRRRRRQGEEAKERVLNRLYAPQATTSSQETSIFDAVRNRPISTEPQNGTPMKELMPKYGSVTPMNLLNGAMQQAQANQKAKEPTEYDVRMAEIAESKAPKPIKAYAKFMTELTYGNPVGRFVSRAGHQADSIMSGGNPVTIQPDTGNKAANVAADVAGSIMSVLTPTGAPVGMGPVAGTYGATDNILSSPMAQRAEQAAVKQLSKVVKPETAQKVTREFARETLAGTMQGATFGAMTGEDDAGIITSALSGGALGGVLGAALPLAGAGMKNLKNTLDSSIPSPSQNLGISGLRTKVKPYDNLRTDTKSQLATRADREPLVIDKMVDRFYTKFVDDVHSFNKMDKLTESVTGESLKASDSTHKLALGTRGSDVVARQIITDKLVDASGNVAGKSLKDVLSRLPKKAQSYVDFEDYLINKHAITRFGRGEKVFRDELQWTPEVGAEKITAYEQQFPEFKEMADELYEFNRNMVNKWLVDTGVISKEQANAWFESNPYYIPNKRKFTDLEKGNGGKSRAKAGFGNQSVPVKKYSKGGSQRQIISPIESMIENVDSIVKTAKRNEVMQKFVQNIQKSPEAFADFAEIVKQPERAANITETLLDGDGIDELLARFSDDFDKSMMKTKLDNDNIVRVLMDGEAVHVKINDPDLLNAITSLGPENGNALLDTIGKLTNTMKVLTTGNNPIFSFTRNLFRDIPQAYIASKTTSNPITFAADLISAAIDIGRQKGAYKDFLNVGGGHSSPVAADRNLLQRSKDTVLPASNNPLRGAIPKLYRKYEDFMNVAEMAPRLAEFKRTAKQYDDLQKALYEAQDVTTNFKRRGSAVRDLDKIFPYMNAAIQGLDQVIRVYKDNPVKALTKSAVALSIPSMVLFAVNHDNPDYQKLNRRTKDAFFLIPKGDGTFIKIAKPQEQGTIFSDIPERMMQMFLEQDPNAFKDFADRLRTTFLPPGIQGAAKSGGITDKMLGVVGDTILGPVADVAANKNFADAPIVPGYMENLSPELQYDAKTTNVAKWVGEKTGTSPKQLDYLARQYTGWIGQLGQPLLAPGGDVGSTLSQQITADPAFSNDISNEFYHYKSKLDQAYTDRDLKKLPEWYNDPLRKQLGKISRSMSAVRTDIRNVQNDVNLDNKAKREKLRELQEKINQLAEMGNDYARKANIPY